MGNQLGESFLAQPSKHTIKHPWKNGVKGVVLDFLAKMLVSQQFATPLLLLIACFLHELVIIPRQQTWTLNQSHANCYMLARGETKFHSSTAHLLWLAGMNCFGGDFSWMSLFTGLDYWTGLTHAVVKSIFQCKTEACSLCLLNLLPHASEHDLHQVCRGSITRPWTPTNLNGGRAH